MMKIEITIPEDIAAAGRAKQYLSTCLFALGYAPVAAGGEDIYSRTAETLAAGTASKQDRQVGKIAELAAGFGADKPSGNSDESENPQLAVYAGGEGQPTTDTALFGTGDVSATSQVESPKRERGKAGEGRKRRTNAEIAEDAAADAADAARAAGEGNISTNPEDRQSPEDETVSTDVDDDATTAQDEADEAREQAARATGAITLDTLRKLAADIGKKHGMPIALKVPKFLGAPLAEIPEDKYGEVVDTMQGMLDADTDDLKGMLDSALGSSSTTSATSAASTKTTDAKPSEPAASRDDLVKAMYRYARYADGTDDQTKMVYTMVDLKVLFKELFNVESQRDIKEADLGSAIAAVDQAIETNRFKRKR